MQKTSKKKTPKTKAPKTKDPVKAQLNQPPKGKKSSSKAKKTAAKSKKNSPQAKKTKAKASKAKKTARRGGEVAGFVVLALGAVLFLSLISFSPHDLEGVGESANLIGPAGAHLANILLHLLGLGAFVFSGVIVLLGTMMLFGRRIEMKPSEIVGHVMLLLGGAGLFHLVFEGQPVLAHMPGGAIGAILGELLRTVFGAVGGDLIAGLLVGLGLILVTDLSFAALGRGVTRTLLAVLRSPLTLTQWIAARRQQRLESISEIDEAEEETAMLQAEALKAARAADKEAAKARDKQAKAAKKAKLDKAKAQKEAKAQKQAKARKQAEAAKAAKAQKQAKAAATKATAAASTQAKALAQASDDEATRVKPSLASKAKASEPARQPQDGTAQASTKAAELARLAAAMRDLDAESQAEIEAARREISAAGDDGNAAAQARIASILAKLPRRKVVVDRPVAEAAPIEPKYEFDSIMPPDEIEQGLLSGWQPKALAQQQEHSEVNEPAPRAAANSALTMPAPAIELIDEPKDQARRDVLNALGLADSSSAEAPPTPPPAAPAPKGSHRRLVEPASAKLRYRPPTQPSAADLTSDLARQELKTPFEIPSRQVKAAEPTQSATRPAGQEVDAIIESMWHKDDEPSLIPKHELREIVQQALAQAREEKLAEAPTEDDPERTKAPGIEARTPIKASAQENTTKAAPEQTRAARPAAQLAAEPKAEAQVEVLPPVTPHESALPLSNAQPVIGPEVVLAESMRRAHAEELEARAASRRPDADSAPIVRPFELPNLSLLHYDPTDQVHYDDVRLKHMADALEAKLKDYSVKGQVVRICPGPVVTRFEFEPAPGTRLSKIANLNGELAMALEAISVRIIAPIPGKNVVGIELPNDERETVYLKEIIGSEAFSESRSVLTLALGKDIEGSAVVTNLAKMPHLLVAGSTGSGKSVAINTMILSLLYNATPDQVKFLMVDPKQLELSIYNGIPHLLLPPITDPKKASVALRWAVDEMERRYKLLAALHVRNIAGYNKRLLTLEHQLSSPDPDLARAARVKLEMTSEGETEHERLPFLVVIIDELADLMMVAKAEVETSIARLAQKARACGIHLVLATQRPSVDVITGIIKVNLPTRLSFRVLTNHDSKTILAQTGAESLLGMGDSLYLGPGTSHLERVHGAFVSDEEVERVVDFLKTQGEPEYREEILIDPEAEAADADGDDDYDELYDQAAAIVCEAQAASASMLQRKLRVGYNRASRIIDQMERDGLIGPADGSRPREVLRPSF